MDAYSVVHQTGLYCRIARGVCVAAMRLQNSTDDESFESTHIDTGHEFKSDLTWRGCSDQAAESQITDP